MVEDTWSWALLLAMTASLASAKLAMVARSPQSPTATGLTVKLTAPPVVVVNWKASVSSLRSITPSANTVWSLLISR